MQTAEPVGREDIERDERGRLKKGAVLNRTGLDPRMARMKRNLEALTPIAIARLGRLLESDNEAVALGAAKEVLDRNFGKAKQQVSLDVTHTHVAHLEALRELASRARGTAAGYNPPQVIDVTPQAAIDHLLQPAEPDLIEAGAVAVGDVPEAATGREPPGSPTPTGAASAAAPSPPTDQKPHAPPAPDTPRAAHAHEAP